VWGRKEIMSSTIRPFPPHGSDLPDAKLLVGKNTTRSPRKGCSRNPASPEVEEDCKLFKNRSWSRTKVSLQSSKLSFFEFSFEINELEKIKILPLSQGKAKKSTTIKLDARKQVVLFSLTQGKKILDLPLAYYLFARLIDKKVLLLGHHPCEEANKGEPISSPATNDSYIYGHIMKRSQNFGKWEQRFVVIKKNGIFSYRDSCVRESYSFHISNDSIKYLWTRFDFIGNSLIIKVKHGMTKTEFGIPITKFSARSTKNWLYCFYRVMPQSL
jgi:hypothetical protein